MSNVLVFVHSINPQRQCPCSMNNFDCRDPPECYKEAAFDGSNRYQNRLIKEAYEENMPLDEPDYETNNEYENEPPSRYHQASDYLSPMKAEFNYRQNQLMPSEAEDENYETENDSDSYAFDSDQEEYDIEHSGQHLNQNPNLNDYQQAHSAGYKSRSAFHNVQPYDSSYNKNFYKHKNPHSNRQINRHPYRYRPSVNRPPSYRKPFFNGDSFQDKNNENRNNEPVSNLD